MLTTVMYGLKTCTPPFLGTKTKTYTDPREMKYQGNGEHFTNVFFVYKQ